MRDWRHAVNTLVFGSALVMSSLMGVGLDSAQAATAAENKAAVHEANLQFYVALNTLFVGDVSAIAALWSHTDDVTYMGPQGGIGHGWPAILKMWEHQAAMKLGGRVEPSEENMIVGDDLAVVINYELGENTNANGKVERVKIRATNSYRKEGGHWKMVGHHTDLLPFLAK